MELETKLGPSSKEPSEDLQSHEIIRVQVKREKPFTFSDRLSVIVERDDR